MSAHFQNVMHAAEESTGTHAMHKSQKLLAPESLLQIRIHFKHEPFYKMLHWLLLKHKGKKEREIRLYFAQGKNLSCH